MIEGRNRLGGGGGTVESGDGGIGTKGIKKVSEGSILT
jgi:hypothetical protein